MVMRGSIMPTKGGCGMGQIRQIKKEISTSIHNRFDVEVIDAKTGEIKQRARGFNVICNRLWNNLFSGNTYFSYIHYGTGSGTPSSADESLFSFLGSKSASNAISNHDPILGIFSLQKKIQILENEAVGQNITEVGISDGSGGPYLCTHAMLQDMNGNPISILKTNSDIINIYATVYAHYSPTGYDGGTIKIIENKASYDNALCIGLLRCLVGDDARVARNVHFYSGRNNLISEVSSISAALTTTRNRQAKTMTLSAARVPASNGNFGGLMLALVGAKDGGYSSDYGDKMWLALDVGGSWFLGANIVGEAIGTGDGESTDFELDFPFASNAKIYVDGIEETNVTVDGGPKDNKVMKYMVMLDPRSESGIHVLSRDITTAIIYNPLYSIGLASLGITSNAELLASDDLETWDFVMNARGYAVNDIPEAFAHKKYWKVSTGYFYTYSSYASFKIAQTANKVHFQVPPASGSVIIADYHTDCIAKDENHVFDFSLVISIDEYSESQ